MLLSLGAVRLPVVVVPDSQYHGNDQPRQRLDHLRTIFGSIATGVEVAPKAGAWWTSVGIDMNRELLFCWATPGGSDVDLVPRQATFARFTSSRRVSFRALRLRQAM